MNAFQRLADLGLRREVAVMRANRAETPELGSGPGEAASSASVASEKRYANLRTLVLYLFVVGGAVAEAAFRDFNNTGSIKFTWALLAWGCVLGAVIFRTVFSGRLDGVHNTVMQCIIAFENGYFGNSILKTMAAAAAKLGDS